MRLGRVGVCLQNTSGLWPSKQIIVKSGVVAICGSAGVGIRNQRGQIEPAITGAQWSWPIHETLADFWTVPYLELYTHGVPERYTV